MCLTPGNILTTSQASSSMDGATPHFTYTFPGQHVYQGVVYVAGHPVEALQKIPDVALSPEDIMVATYPKCGTNWMTEVADVVHHDGDIQKAARAVNTLRWPVLELKNNLEVIQTTSSPRLLKTHLNNSFLTRQVREQGVKTIVVLRNPKDCLVSYYHFYRMNTHFGNFPGTWGEFFEIFRAGQLTYGDPIEHMAGWWALRDLPNVEVFMYEEMLQDSPAAVRRLGQFLGKQFTDTQVEAMVKHTSFDSMKKCPTTSKSTDPAFKENISNFYRKGVAGDWKNYFTEEQNTYMDEVIARKLAGTGLTFIFE